MLQNPSVCRGGTPCTPASFEEALYCCVFHSELSAKAIADAIGIKYSYLTAAADPHRADTHIQSRWLPVLMHVTGNVAPLRYLAASLGCALVQLPSSVERGDAIYERLADVVRELGEDTAAIQHVLSDGHVTAEEVAHVDREVGDTIEALLTLRAAVRARASSLASPAPTVSKPAAARMALPQIPGRKAARA